MRVKTRVLTILLVVLLTAMALLIGVSASGIGFSVSPNIPDNQYSSVSTYFDLMMEPGQTQEISVTVMNQSEEDIVVSVEAIPASTNRNGIIIYSDPEANLDDSIPYNFTELAQVKERNVTIAPGTTYDAVVTLTMPSEEFDGVILGAVQVLKELTEEEKEAGGMILNQYSYITAIQLRMNENPIEPEFSLGNIQAGLVNYRASIVADVHNTQPLVAKGVDATAKVYPVGSDEAVIEVARNDISFAPSSVFPFVLMDEAGYGIQAGDYVAKVQLSREGRTWEFEQEFTIEAEEAAMINSEAVNQNTQRAFGAVGGLPSWATIALIGGGVLVLIVIILIVIMAKRSRDVTIDLSELMPPDKK